MMKHKPSGLFSKIKWWLFRVLPDQWLSVSLPEQQTNLKLTFDDGPHPLYTPVILDILDQFEIKAIFFLIGRQAQAHPDVVLDMVSRGHSIGNHSWNHIDFNKMSVTEQMQEIIQTEKLLQTFDGRKKHLFRPPNGSVSLTLLFELIKHNIIIFLWSFNSLDYLISDARELAESVSNAEIQRRDVILFHDDAGHTIDALKILLPQWREKGLL